MNDPCEVLITLLFSVIYKRKVSGYNRDLFANTELREDRSEYILINIYLSGDNGDVYNGIIKVNTK
jgi:hypothetical protein